MTYLLLAIILLGVIVAVATLFSHRKDGHEEVVKTAPSCATCNGANDKCEQECMMEAATKEIEYYDDEELDAFRGRPSDSYTSQETDEFAGILYTMRPQEVRGWTRSLTLRGINLPDQIKDEVIMIIDDNEHEAN